MVDDRAKKVLAEYADQVLEKYKEKLISNNVPASGEILNLTVESNIEYSEEGTEYSINFSDDAYLYIEQGRQPGSFPPVDAIKQWIQAKPIIPKPFQLPNGKSVLPTNDQLAFLIGRKIQNEGIQARPFLQEIIDELQEEFKEKLQQAIRDDAYEQFENQLTE